jgi:hypothetical protein
MAYVSCMVLWAGGTHRSRRAWTTKPAPISAAPMPTTLSTVATVDAASLPASSTAPGAPAMALAPSQAAPAALAVTSYLPDEPGIAGASGAGTLGV